MPCAPAIVTEHCFKPRAVTCLNGVTVLLLIRYRTPITAAFSPLLAACLTLNAKIAYIGDNVNFWAT